MQDRSNAGGDHRQPEQALSISAAATNGVHHYDYVDPADGHRKHMLDGECSCQIGRRQLIHIVDERARALSFRK